MIRAEDNVMLESQKSIYDIASNTDQHFWMTETGDDTGAHITEKTKEDFLSAPASGGGNLLARSNGIAVRDGLTELASFGADAITIGNAEFSDENMGTSHVVIDKQGMGVTYWEDGYPPTKQTFVEFGMASGSMSEDLGEIGVADAWRKVLMYTPQTGSEIRVIESLGSAGQRAYTFRQGVAKAESVGTNITLSYDGNRTFTSTGYTGSGSIESMAWFDSIEYNAFVYAGGYANVGSRDPHYVMQSNSSTFGTMLVAEEQNQVATGYYNLTRDSNDESANYAFMVGNGSSANRSNALAVDWDGNLDIAGTLTQSSDRRLKDHIDYLDGDADEFIRQLKPAHYIKDDKHHVGFYAQDVDEADKWDCMTGEMNGYMTLGYTELIAPLVAYCQHLEERIKKLEKEK